MFPFVSLQVTRHRESLVTLGARIRFLSGVNSHVSPQGVWPGEGLCTLGAGVRLHATVCPLVSLQVIRPRESQVTLGTGIWFISSMYSLVSFKPGRVEKHLPTNLTLESGHQSEPHANLAGVCIMK